MARYFRFYLHTRKQQYASRCHSDEAKRGRISRLHARSFAEAQDDGRSAICAIFPEKRVHGVARKRLVAKQRRSRSERDLLRRGAMAKQVNGGFRKTHRERSGVHGDESFPNCAKAAFVLY